MSTSIIVYSNKSILMLIFQDSFQVAVMKYKLYIYYVVIWRGAIDDPMIEHWTYHGATINGHLPADYAYLEDLESKPLAFGSHFGDPSS